MKKKSKEPSSDQELSPAEELELWKRKAYVAERLRFEKNKSELKDARSEISLLAAGVAHEFNNILGAVDGHAEWALSTGTLDDMKTALEVARTACLRSSQITRALQGLSQVREESFELLDAKSLVSEMGKLFLGEAKLNGITLELQSPADLNPKIYVDPSRISEVLINLLRNAIDVLSDSPKTDRKISFGLQKTQERVIYFVEDSGPGIAREFQDLIFQPFFTTKGVMKLVKSAESAAVDVSQPAPSLGRGGGSGLGLFLSRAIAREHSGDLQLKPCQVLGGARFELSLPENT